MRNKPYLPALLIGLIALTSCEKDIVEPPFDEPLSQPYTSGLIKLQHQTIIPFSGRLRKKDTTVMFSSIGNDPAYKDDYGYYKPSIPWAQLIRINPANADNRASVLFVDINLDSLKLPYTFKAGDTRNAQVVYKTGSGSFYDAGFNLIHGRTEYGGSTYWDEFQLTVLSKTNNRVQGTFSGIVRNHDGQAMKIEKGLFDVEIVVK